MTAPITASATAPLDTLDTLDTVVIAGPRVIDLGTIASTDELRIAAEIVQKFGYTIRLTLDSGVMTITAEAPPRPPQ